MFKFDALTEVTQYLELLVLVSLQWIERIRMLRPTHWGSWIFYQDFRGNHQFKLSLKTVEPFSIKQRNFYDQTWVQNHLWPSQYQHFYLKCLYWIPWVMLIKKLWWWYLHEAVSLPKFQARGKQLHRCWWPSHRPWPSLSTVNVRPGPDSGSDWSAHSYPGPLIGHSPDPAWARTI